MSLTRSPVVNIYLPKIKFSLTSLPLSDLNRESEGEERRREIDGKTQTHLVLNPEGVSSLGDEG